MWISDIVKRSTTWRKYKVERWDFYLLETSLQYVKKLHYFWVVVYSISKTHNVDGDIVHLLKCLFQDEPRMFTSSWGKYLESFFRKNTHAICPNCGSQDTTFLFPYIFFNLLWLWVIQLLQPNTSLLLNKSVWTVSSALFYVMCIQCYIVIVSF